MKVESLFGQLAYESPELRRRYDKFIPIFIAGEVVLRTFSLRFFQ